MKQHIALVLAAGHSKRYGSDKRMSGSDEPLMSKTIKSLEDIYSHIVVVHRYEDPILLTELIPLTEKSFTVTLCQAPVHPIGLGVSLSQGINCIKHSYDVKLINSISIFLADMPFIKQTTMLKLLAASTIDNIVRPCFKPPCSSLQLASNDSIGHPVIFGRNFIEQLTELTELTNDKGANQVVKKHINKLVVIDVDDKGVIQDIDQPADWHR